MRNRGSKSKASAIVSFLSVGLILIAAAAVHAQSPVTPPGTGTELDPYLISELGHLVWMGDTVGSSSGKYYTLTCDIDASDTANWNGGFAPIGTSSTPFTGIFDGDWYTITGLVINRPSTSCVGLFGKLGGEVRNLGIEGGAVTAYYFTGSLAGLNYGGAVFNCHSTATVIGNDAVGGLVGSNNTGTVSSCYATGGVTGDEQVGGLIGTNFSGTVSNSYATSAVSGTTQVGGLVGDNRGDISDCYAIGAVMATSDQVGGLVGCNSGTVSDSYWDTQTSGQSGSAGGEGKTTAEMMQQATFLGWDFIEIWSMIEGVSCPWLPTSAPPFKLTVVIEGLGSVTVDPESPDGTYAAGTVVTLTATPIAPGDAFNRWFGALPSDSPTASIVMNMHRTVTAKFLPKIEINSLDDLAKIGNNPTYPLDSTTHYVLMADIDASATADWNDDGTDTVVLEGFKPIGTASTPFMGTFDGNGHTITGLVVNRPNTNDVGLFARVGMFGEVRNLGMVGGAVTGLSYVGGLVGRNDEGTVSNCYATGAVTGAGDVGGQIGWNEGVVSSCYASATITGNSYVGGLVGYNTNDATVSNCYATGTVTAKIHYVGGLVGYNTNDATVSNCYATGAVTGDSDVGGLVGESNGTVSDSYWDVDTTGQSTSAGGEGKTTAEMMQQATFVGWDFTDIWDMIEGASCPWLPIGSPPFKLTVDIVGPGSVTIDPESPDGTYAAGTMVTLTATPSGPDDELARWLGAVPIDSPTVTIIMNIDRSVIAKFRTRIEINSLADLAKIGNDPAYPLDSTIHYVLTADIDASDTANWNDDATDTTVLEGFKPIGTYSEPDTTSFRGIFDGNGHTITGLVINRSETNYVGLFGMLGDGGEVRNLGLIGGEIMGHICVGGLVGKNSDGTVSNCYATGAVTGADDHVGGLVGDNYYYGTVSNCYATGAVTGEGNYVGGLVGTNYYGTVSNCYATGAVTGVDYVGGLIGNISIYATVSNCYATGVVNGSFKVGGLAGDNGGDISNCYAIGAVTGTSNCVGGLVGYSDWDTVSDCFATGAVTGEGNFVGGLIGYNISIPSGTLSNCYATGAVVGDGSYVGGLVGYSYDVDISNCYATGAVVGDGSYVGGLVGRSDYGTVSNSYWDVETTGQNTSDGGEGKTTAEMMQQGTFVGWDFATVWGINESESYPWLQVSPLALPPFKLTINIEGPGSVTVDPESPYGDGTYDPGTVVTLTATPNGPVNEFIQWLGAEPSDSRTATVVMDIHRSVTGVFSMVIEINSLAQLAMIGNDPAYPLDANYVLTTDIDASETATWNDEGTTTYRLEGFKPIGNYDYYNPVYFRGIFNGDGHTITGLVINRPNEDSAGLFGAVDTEGQVRNLGMIDCDIEGNSYTGGLVGRNNGTVSNCYATGAVMGNYYVGGLVGDNCRGKVSDCYTDGETCGNSSVGGLVGSNDGGTVTNCFAMGMGVGGTGYYYDDFDIGGLVGSNSGYITNCFTSLGVYGGGILDVGGLVGWNAGVVSNCHANGDVEGIDYVGGLVGENYDGTVSNCYAVGAVRGDYDYVGGLIGFNWGTVSDSYWDIQTSGQSTSDGGVGKTTAQMKQQATFVGWDFGTIWSINEGVYYPILQFSPLTYKLTVEVVGPGSVTCDPESTDGTYAAGTVVTLTATPSESDDAFYRWLGATPTDSPTAKVVMDRNRLVRGTFRHEIEINSLAQLAMIGNDPAYPLDNVYYTLTADIDASETANWNDEGTDTSLLEGFKPIGTYSNPDTTSFRGIFDGNGHTINGLVINRPNTDYVGLFGIIGYQSKVRSLGMLGGTITGRSNVGGLLGRNAGGLVLYCYTTGEVSGCTKVGGLVGSGSVHQCYANGVVKGGSFVGGLVGWSSSYVYQSYATSAVTGAYGIGGLVGLNYHTSTVSNCYATGAVMGEGAEVGGLIGINYDTVLDSYWNIKTSGKSASDGGEGKTTAEMMQQATFADWRFDIIWSINEPASYPWLQFSPPPFKLTVNTVGPGSVTIDPESPYGDGTYDPGTVVTLTATAGVPGDVVIQWIGAEPLDSSTATVVMDNHKSVTAMFQQYIEIDTLAELAMIGNDPAYPLDNVRYVLTADIDASDTANWNDEGTDTSLLEGFMPIGTDSMPFTGIFDGNGHTITGLVINRPNTDYVGLFGFVGRAGEVNNLGMVDGTVTGKDNVGSLTGRNGGTVLYCYASGAVTGEWSYIGGLVGRNHGMVSNCYATGAVIGHGRVGGLAGGNYYGTVSNCYATGAVTCAHDYVGGLVGWNYYGTVSNCYATGAVTGDGNVGGLVGDNEYGVYSTVSNSYWDVETSGRSTSDGGEGKTTAEMMQQATFVGWNFANVWGIVENNTYPYLQSLYDPADPPVVTSAVSYKTHGTVGEFGINVLDGANGNDIECRRYGVTKLVVGFDIDIQGVGGLDASDVSLSSGTVDAVALTAGNELTIEMTDTTNGEPLTVSFPGIANVLDEAVVCVDSICIRQLVGDVYPDGVITALDRVKVRDAMVQAIDASNFRADVHADGVFAALDRVIVRDAMTTGFVGSCP